MSSAENDLRIDYLEFPVTDIEATKRFYGDVFGWRFQDYGPEYTAFVDGRLAGGFELRADVRHGGALVVIYAENLERTQRNVIAAGGTVSRDTFNFPGGRRFHFLDPSGHELAVWSDH